MKKFCPAASGEISFGVISAVAFGTSPFFARNLFAAGFSVDSVLFFRFLPAVLVLCAMAVCRRHSLRFTLREIQQSAVAGMLFCATSFLLFLSYRDMDVGIAATLLFLYPVFVVVISAFFFKERLTGQTGLALFLAVAGVALLSVSDSAETTSPRGIALALLSALCYAGYQVWTARSGTNQIPAEKLTFFIVSGCFLFYAVRVQFGMALQGVFSLAAWGNIAGVSMIGALLAMGCSALSLQRCGATVTSVLGSLEPLTAVLIGVCFFCERVSMQKCCGIAMILSAVLCIIVRKRAFARQPAERRSQPVRSQYSEPSQ